MTIIRTKSAESSASGDIPDAASHTALGLHALQHRGQEAAGIVTCDGDRFHSHRGLGHVADNFGSEAVIKRLPGSMAVGHVRYSTQGETVLRNVQPLFADFAFGGFAIGHNGNLTNALTIRRQLVRRGCLFQSTSDTEVIVHLIAISLYSTVEDRMIDALRQVEGAYSLVALSKDTIIGVRDPLGIRPLVLGRLKNGAWIVTSKPARWTSSAPNSCAMSSRANWSSWMPAACAASAPSPSRSSASASSSISISPAPI